jgi:hypothetical protein
MQNLREASCKGPDFAPKSGDFGLRESESPDIDNSNASYICPDPQKQNDQPVIGILQK